MNKYLGLLISIVLAYILIIFTPYMWPGVIAGLFLYKFEKWRALVLGLIIGSLTAMSLYLQYPLSYVLKLAEIISKIVLFPSILILIIYPLLFGTIMGLGAFLASGIMRQYKTD